MDDIEEGELDDAVAEPVPPPALPPTISTAATAGANADDMEDGQVDDNEPGEYPDPGIADPDNNGPLVDLEEGELSPTAAAAPSMDLLEEGELEEGELPDAGDESYVGIYTVFVCGFRAIKTGN